VVPETSGGVQICIDAKPFNEHVQWEVHLMPKVDTTLPQLTGAVHGNLFYLIKLLIVTLLNKTHAAYTHRYY